MMLDQYTKKLIYLILGINIFPHIFTLPYWVTAVSGFLYVWSLLNSYRSVWALPRPILLKLLVVLGSMGIFLQYGTFMGQEPATALLVLMVSAKSLELNNFRDGLILIFLCYFLLMAKLIDSQSIEMTLFMIMDVLFITTVLAVLHSPHRQEKLKSLISRALFIALPAVPLTLLLFFVFPRFSMNAMTQSKKQLAEVGFSDQLRPGSVAQIAQSEKVAFRVSFPFRQPDSLESLYWRGLVLTTSRGLHWEKGMFQKSVPINNYNSKNTEIVQDIFIEPSADPYLFALDWPMSMAFSGDAHSKLVRTSEGKVFESKINFSSRLYYRAYSILETKHLDWPSPNPDIYLHVDAEVSIKMNQLVKEFQLKSDRSSASLVDQILKYFRLNKFRYSLQPGEMSDLEDFLFNKRVGFCEHYAGAMATLLRLSGVPARVIIGFQGGRPSLLKDYYLVRYMDAHAWVEYWDSKEKSWMRVDPVEVVAPQRLIAGAQAYNEMLLQEKMDLSFTNIALPYWIKGGWKEISERVQLIWDQSESLWVNFLLRYDWSFQKDIFHKIALDNDGQWRFIFTSIIVSLVVIVLGIFLIHFFYFSVDSELEIYRYFCKVLADAGLERIPSEGPLSFYRRAELKFPHAKTDLLLVFTSIMKWRYGNLIANKKDLKQIKKTIRYLKFELEERSFLIKSYKINDREEKG